MSLVNKPTKAGSPIDREDLFKYTNGRFLANEKKAVDRRYVTFDLDQLCAVAATTGGRYSPVCAIDKMEGGFSKALLLRREDGSEVVAKIPFPIAGPPKYTTASEVAVLIYRPDLSSYGTALVERELAILQNRTSDATFDSPRGTLDEQIDTLNMTKEVMSRLNDRTLIGKVSEPVLWHTDLHMGNIYVSGRMPPQISSIIDWQSIVVSPLFLQARFPKFLTVDDDYKLGTIKLPDLPPDLDKMNAEDRELAEYKFQQAKEAKVYEVSTAATNMRVWRCLLISSFLRELFTRCGEVSEEGEIPLRACLLQVVDLWDEIGFEGECPLNFSEEDVQRLEQQFEKYSNYHKVHEFARGILNADFEGWINPMLDFPAKQQQNKELLEEFVRRSSEFGMTPEEMRRIWPYSERD
ncbi:hypothetical protein J4E85_006333 [Alternaria conjuncta]|uniref:uncharacterized protein n=1 Tax=Alternaria conjuncta TaxID=181017 RepID=UPI00221EF257|nr:uncharacterized protein J4E85_006333 [Alternaria conjuncta]KAI4927821.1 hypothetical protein J4E85_006333 [Alternaria conjuncta]